MHRGLSEIRIRYSFSVVDMKMLAYVCVVIGGIACASFGAFIMYMLLVRHLC